MKLYDGVHDSLCLMKLEVWKRAHLLDVLGYDGVTCSLVQKSEDALYRSSAFLGDDELIYEVGGIHDLNLLPHGVEAVADGYIDRYGDFVPRSNLTKTDALRTWLQAHQKSSHDAEAMRVTVGHMLGHLDSEEALLTAAQLLAPPGAQWREVTEGSNPVDSALLAWGLTPTDTLRAQLLELAPIAKAEGFRPALTPMHVESVQPNGEPVADAVRRAEAKQLIYEAHLGGKHSSGVAVAMDPRDDTLWLLKPGSGPLSPGAGIQDVSTTQARREVAAANVGASLLPATFPPTYLLTMGGQEVAAIRVVPRDAVPAKSLTVDARKIFAAHAADGTLFQWAAIDWVLGNVDRHGGNVLVAPKGRVYLIDHGSTLAGSGFNPAVDAKSFVPYYLRAWAPDWAHLDIKQRRAALPDAAPGVHVAFGHWIRNVFTADKLRPIHELAPEAEPAVLSRLRDLQVASDPLGHLLDLWTGVASPSHVAHAVQQLEKANPPFNPRDFQGDRGAVYEWQAGWGNREDVPAMPPEAKARALHRMGAVTDVRRAADGKREFLLHRAMGNDELTAAVKGGHVRHQTMSSWTPVSDVYGRGRQKVSAWIHEDAIHMIPKQLGAMRLWDKINAKMLPGGPNEMAPEYEVIVKPHRSALHTAQPGQLEKAEQLMPIANLLVSSNSLRNAWDNVSRGHTSRTGGPLEVWRLEDGRHLLVDGHHRLAEAMLSGAHGGHVPVNVVGSGYTDYWATPRVGDEFKYTPTRFGGLERFGDDSVLSGDARRLAQSKDKR